MTRLIVLVAVLSACVEAEERPARWSYVYGAVLQPACTTSGCHSKLSALAGVDLSDREGAYNILTGHVCGEIAPGAPPRNYVTPGSSEYSQLIEQLRGENRNVMPPDYPLPAVEVEMVARWIDGGAQCD
ncbi:MAG: hypothetical protein M4D80_38910 [Myxococcota bacterium]|nr:hypothetical protein [Myxococcota bacterium]